MGSTRVGWGRWPPSLHACLEGHVDQALGTASLCIGPGNCAVVVLWQGKMLPIEEDIRVPFYIRGPGIPRGVVTDYQVQPRKPWRVHGPMGLCANLWQTPPALAQTIVACSSEHSPSLPAC